MKKEKTFN